jgi:putative lipopolysaccharide biosynthesis protein
MTNEELSQQIAALTTTVTEKFDRIDTRFEQIDKRFEQIDKRFEDIDGRLNTLQAGQDDLRAKYDDLAMKYDDLKAGQDDLVTKYDELKAGQDDLRAKYDEMNEKQGHIVNAQKTIAKMQADLQHTVEEQGAKLEEDFTDMKAVQASIQHDIARINRKMVVETGVRDTMHESVFTTQDSHYRDLDRRLRLVEAHFPDLGQQGA